MTRTHTRILQSYRMHYVLSFLVCVALCTYLYFLAFAMVHTAKASAQEKILAEVQVHVSALEQQYLAKSSAITPELARQRGFVDATPHLLSRGSALFLSLSDGTPVRPQ